MAIDQLRYHQTSHPGRPFFSYVAFTARDYGADATENLAPTMRSLAKGADGHQSGSHGLAVAYPINSMNAFRSPDAAASTGLGVGHDGEAMYTLTKGDHHAVAFDWKMDAKARSIGLSEEQSPTLSTGADRYAVLTSEPAIYQDSEFGVQAYDQAGTLRAGRIPAHQMTLQNSTQAVDVYNGAITGEVCATMGTSGSPINSAGPQVMQQSTVRRLTPVECERLQGFPDNFTAIPWRKKGAEDCPDGPRYKALGNSMAVPVMRWIGERINLIDDYLSII
jgi:DNA (cytosine-5)-methyltransferase 1